MDATRSRTFYLTDCIGHLGSLTGVLSIRYVAYHPQVRAVLSLIAVLTSRNKNTYLPVSIWTLNVLPPSWMFVTYSTSPTSDTDVLPIMLALRTRPEDAGLDLGLPRMFSRAAPAKSETKPRSRGIERDEGFMVVVRRDA